MNRDTHEMLNRLTNAGIKSEDAFALRRISMTLHAWDEAECGNDRGCIERDEETGKPYWTSAMSDRRWKIADRERGALKRLQAIMVRYPDMTAYHQSDCRGAALYIVRNADLPEGCNIDSYYSIGIAV